MYYTGQIVALDLTTDQFWHTSEIKITDCVIAFN